MSAYLHVVTNLLAQIRIRDAFWALRSRVQSSWLPGPGRECGEYHRRGGPVPLRRLAPAERAARPVARRGLGLERRPCLQHGRRADVAGSSGRGSDPRNPTHCKRARVRAGGNMLNNVETKTTIQSAGKCIHNVKWWKCEACGLVLCSLAFKSPAGSGTRWQRTARCSPTTTARASRSPAASGPTWCSTRLACRQPPQSTTEKRE